MIEKNIDEIKTDAVITTSCGKFDILNQIITSERFYTVAKIAREIAYTHCAEVYPKKGSEFKEKAIDGDLSNVFLDDMTDSVYSGTFNQRDNKIVCRPIYKEKDILRILVHENIHAASFYLLEEKVDGDKIYVKSFSGFSRLECVEKITETGKKVEGRKTNWSLNEGATEILTFEALRKYGLGGSPSVNYILSVEWALQLKKLVGEEMFYEAYFDGDTVPMEKYINSLYGDERCWNALVKNLDAGATNRDLLKTVGNVKWIRETRKLADSTLRKLNRNKLKGSLSDGKQNDKQSV